MPLVSSAAAVERLISLIGDGLVTNPWLQGILIALSTFVLEDPTTVGSGLLVADGHVPFVAAFLGLWAGIALGDMGLYGIGRFLGPQAIRWGLIKEQHMTRVQHWFERNMVGAVLLSRFVPGMRIPTYVGAGLFQASAIRFLAVTVGATLIWTVLLLNASILIGEQVFPLLGRYRWPAAVLLLVGLVVIQRTARRRIQADVAADQSDETESPLSFFEFWPPLVFYFPVGIYYAWLVLRYRSFTLPTLANPGIYAGGLIFESKNDILDRVPAEIRCWFAPHVRFRHDAPGDIDLAEAAMARAGISYPIVAKPDKGQRGSGVQPVGDRDELAAYLAAFPLCHEIQIQQRVPYENEVGILYYRYPDGGPGRIFSVTRKYFPSVTGDGSRSLAALIEGDPRARLLKAVYFPRHAGRLDEVIPAGETIALVFSGSHARGAIFKDGRALVTPALTARIDAIARALPEFYFGRFDIRFRDEASLMQGEAFQIIEINGAGAESTHIWDARTRLRDAYKTLFEQFTILFRIGDQNRRRGFRALGTVQFLRDCRAYRRLSRDYPITR